MWWLYFDMPAGEVVERARLAFTDRLTDAFTWGYGHYAVFSGAAAAGAGLAVAVDQATGHSRLTDLQAGFALSVPVTIYVLAVWGLHFRHKAPSGLHTYGVPVAAAVILGSSATPEPVLGTGAVLAVLAALGVALDRPQRSSHRGQVVPQ
jgi:low temperature requirement protein LtrA